MSQRKAQNLRKHLNSWQKVKRGKAETKAGKKKGMYDYTNT